MSSTRSPVPHTHSSSCAPKSKYFTETAQNHNFELEMDSGKCLDCPATASGTCSPSACISTSLEHSCCSTAPTPHLRLQVRAGDQPWGQLTCFPPGPPFCLRVRASISCFRTSWASASEVGGRSLTPGWEMPPAQFLSIPGITLQQFLAGGPIHHMQNTRAQA